MVDTTFNSDSVFSVVGTEEFVITKYTAWENFQRTHERKLFKMFTGKTFTTIEVMTTYKYYFKPTECQFDISNNILTVTVPQIYLSLPVSPDLSSMKFHTIKNTFGISEIENQSLLLNSMTIYLNEKGMKNKSRVESKAIIQIGKIVQSIFIQQGLWDKFNLQGIKVVLSNMEDQPDFLMNFGGE